jgi:four helix bundle protein
VRVRHPPKRRDDPAIAGSRSRIHCRLHELLANRFNTRRVTPIELAEFGSSSASSIEQANRGTGEAELGFPVGVHARRIARSPAVACSTALLLKLVLAMAFMFEKLEVYQKAVDFTGRVTDITEQFPRRDAFVVDQLNRAALSIPANVAEGNGRFTKAHRRNFFTVARGSTQECIPLLELARRRGLIRAVDHSSLRGELEVIAKMISGLIAGLQKRAK